MYISPGRGVNRSYWDMLKIDMIKKKDMTFNSNPVYLTCKKEKYY